MGSTTPASLRRLFGILRVNNNLVIFTPSKNSSSFLQCYLEKHPLSLALLGRTWQLKKSWRVLACSIIARRISKPCSPRLREPSPLRFLRSINNAPPPDNDKVTEHHVYFFGAVLLGAPRSSPPSAHYCLMPGVHYFQPNQRQPNQPSSRFIRASPFMKRLSGDRKRLSPLLTLHLSSSSPLCLPGSGSRKTAAARHGTAQCTAAGGLVCWWWLFVLTCEPIFLPTNAQ